MEKLATITNTVICIVVIVIIVATTIIPVIDDAKLPGEVIINNDDFYYSDLVGETGSHTITYDSNGSSVTPVNSLVIDDVEMKILDNGRIPILITDSIVMWTGSNNASMAISVITGESEVTSYAGVVNTDISIDAATKTVSVTNIVIGTTSYDDFEVTYSDFSYLMGKSGNYAVMGSNGVDKEIYVSSSASIFAFGMNGSNTWFWVHGEDSYSMTDPVTLTATLTEVPDYEGLYSVLLTSSVETSGIILTSDDVSFVPSVVIVPKSVVATTYNTSLNLLWSVIPIMLLMVPIMLAVRAFTGRD